MSGPASSSSHHDSLTGLPNRRLRDDRLKQALQIAVYGGGVADADALLRNADAALYRARHGRDPLCIYA